MTTVTFGPFNDFCDFFQLFLNFFTFFSKLFTPFCLSQHAILTQRLLSVCTTGRDIDSDDSYAHSSCMLHSPLSGSSVNESCAHRIQSRYTANMVAERC